MISNPWQWSVAIVDLGALELAGVIDVNGFPFREEIEAGLTGFAMTVASAAHAAERELDLGAGGAVVDVNQAGEYVAHGCEGPVHVLCKDRGGQTILRTVVDLDGLLQRADLDDGENGSEDLFPFEGGTRKDTVEQVGW